jgi:predicted component of type VI protein secretion system
MAARYASFITRLAQAPAQADTTVILRNLEHLFNTRKGCGSVVAEFGLGDYEAAPTTHDAVILLRAELEALTRRYEPRLASPQVRLLGGYGYCGVRFELRGRARGDELVLWIDIDTTTRAARVAVGEPR